MKDMLKEEYICINGGCIPYEGLSFLIDKFEKYISGPVKKKFEDCEWSTMLTNAAVSLTGFSEENFTEIFANREVENYWRIGEIIAECTLEDKYNARFYYNNSRDAKNLRSNAAGADLVGFGNIGSEVSFLFGEVKTSSDERTPPQVLYGKSGMIQQLENLKNDRLKRHDLVKWIFSKAIKEKGNFLMDCKAAMYSYVTSNHNKIQLIGVLVRDTNPNEKDLRSRAVTLSGNIPEGMEVKLISLYVPLKMENKNWERAMNRGE